MSLDESSISLGLERIKECSGAFSNACILHTDEVVSEKLILSRGKAGSKEKISLDEFKGCPQDEAEENIQGKEHELSYTAQEHRPREGVSQKEFQDFHISKRKRKNWWKRFVNIRKSGEGNVRSKLNAGTNKTQRIKVKLNKKRCLEFSGLYLGQEVARQHLGADSFLLSCDQHQMQAAIGAFDGIIDTVSTVHPLLPLIGLLKSHGKIVMVGAPDKPLELPIFPLLAGRKIVDGSLIGGLKETQEMIDFAVKHKKDSSCQLT
ncbi:putative mannitol dehydrogenase [Glycine soja]|uniref:Putative mannitol dehydrogenase n=1 Tax=Glycine soja TaxID=3848 RepID=A0A445LPE2_GLYSO|nr:putative mannitol dehydrogenase [Glycine soja]